MDARRMDIIHRRQLGLPLSDLFPPPPKTSSTSSSTTETSSSTSAISTSTSLSINTTSSTSTTTTTTASSSSTTTTAPSTTSTSDIATPTPVILPSSNTITVIETASAPSTAASPSTTAVATTNQAFLQNKAASGVVFGLVGLVGLVLIVMAATFFIRRRRSNRLLNEALSFDPVDMGSDSPNMMETGRGGPVNDRSSTSTGYASHGNGPLVTHAAPFSDYALPPAVPYTPSKQPTSQQQNSYPAGARQYASGYSQTAIPAYQGPQRVSEDEKSRRSGSSSDEFQFAAVTAPMNVSSARR